MTEERTIYRAYAQATGWYKNGRYLKTWRDGAEERPETVTAYADTPAEARTKLLRKVVSSSMRVITEVTVSEA
jgi:hypothetical protein